MEEITDKERQEPEGKAAYDLSQIWTLLYNGQRSGSSNKQMIARIQTIIEDSQYIQYLRRRMEDSRRK
jgi:hypothetical protein